MFCGTRLVSLIIVGCEENDGSVRATFAPPQSDMSVKFLVDRDQVVPRLGYEASWRSCREFPLG